MFLVDFKLFLKALYLEASVLGNEREFFDGMVLKMTEASAK